MTFESSQDETGLLSAFTLAFWLTCLACGVIGFLIRYPDIPMPKSTPEPVVARLINVTVMPTGAPSPQVNQNDVTPSDDDTPPAVPQVYQPGAPPAAAPLEAVALPAPTVAFAVPVDRPSRVVPASQAIVKAPPKVKATDTSTDARPVGPPTVRHLVYGQGDAQQPQPEYPEEARLQHEQGTIIVRFEVDEDGHVTHADVISPCPWPLLNQSALRTVRDTWQLPPGEAGRIYDVPIGFELRKN